MRFRNEISNFLGENFVRQFPLFAVGWQNNAHGRGGNRRRHSHADTACTSRRSTFRRWSAYNVVNRKECGELMPPLKIRSLLTANSPIQNLGKLTLDNRSINTHSFNNRIHQSPHEFFSPVCHPKINPFSYTFHLDFRLRYSFARFQCAFDCRRFCCFSTLILPSRCVEMAWDSLTNMKWQD